MAMPDPPIQRIGIVGAGFAGLTSARYLKEFGFDVVVFDKEREVGGVWASTRRYPGLTTQNVRSTYALSDFPYPADYPEWPTGEQVQHYIDAYVDAKGLRDDLRLGAEVVSAAQEESGSWTLVVRDVDSGKQRSEQFDHLVVCNGIFSEPFVPALPGAEDFADAGGRICHTTEFHDASQATGRDVVVVGFGKSSCDVANAVAPVADSTTIVARKIIWKIPKKFLDKLNYKYLMLTRMGEALFPYIEREGVERFLHGSGRPIRNGMLGSLQSVVARQFHLEELDLHPHTPLETIVRSTVSLASDNFFEKVSSGELVVEREAQITRLEPGRAHLSNGKELPADIVICGTGFNQRVPFFDADLHARVTDDSGNFRLYRQILPLEVPNLTFNGYNSSFLSQLNAEIGALWIAALLTGRLRLPPRGEMEAQIDKRLSWMEERTEGKHSKGTNIIPFSMHNVDELLDDLGLGIAPHIHLKEWLLPIDPSDYEGLEQELKRRPPTSEPAVGPGRPAAAASEATKEAG
jgi:dimethylaniline monooxygenase (N-oxide forming)